MRQFLPMLILCALCACDKGDSGPGSKLLGERLIAEHGEGVLASPVLVVYDSGFMVGSESLDPEFTANIAKLGLKPASSLSAGASPVPLHEFYSQEGVEFGVSDSQRLVVLDSTSSLTIRLLFGQPGIRALRACEAVKLERVCKVGEELRARLDEVAPREASIIDGGVNVAKGEIRGEWAIFPDAPDVSDRAELELLFEDGVRCNLSKWLIDPRDSCQI